MSWSCTCPECGLRAEVTVFLDAADSSRALAAALALPASLAGRIVRYLRLFSPPNKTLAARKAARLIGELAQAVTSGEVRAQGQVWGAPVEVWEAALDAVLERPPERLPLPSHGYLLAAVASQAAKRRRADPARAPVGAGLAPAIDRVLTELTNDLRALQTLERATPGVHADAIARLEAAIAERRALSQCLSIPEDDVHA